MTAIVIAPDGTTTDHELPKDSLKFLQTHVGGLVTAINIASDLDMWVSDELPDPTRNLVAEAILEHEAGHQLAQQIRGTVVLTGVNLNTGDTTPLSVSWAKRIGQYKMPMYGFVMLPPTIIPRRS